jgi:predicted tellurium resistance membrane protein TerC
MSWLTDPQAWLALLTLTAVEIVLGVDNIIFISILVAKLPSARQRAARIAGLTAAMVMRILLLLSLTWVMRLTYPLFTILSREISGRDLILILGGLFLLGKSTLEIHDKLEGEEHPGHGPARGGFWSTIAQIMVLDIVFSLDSVITAIGLVDEIAVMVLAIVIAVGIMMLSAGMIGRFVDRHPTIQMLALSFLLLIGLALVCEGIDVHIPKSSIYFAMAFSVFVELLNMKVRRRVARPVQLRNPRTETEAGG